MQLINNNFGFSTILVALASISIMFIISMALNEYYLMTKRDQERIKKQNQIRELIETLKFQFQDSTRCTQVLRAINLNPMNTNSKNIILDMTNDNVVNAAFGAGTRYQNAIIDSITLTLENGGMIPPGALPKNGLNPKAIHFLAYNNPANPSVFMNQVESTVYKYKAKLSIIPQDVPWNPKKEGNFMDIFIKIRPLMNNSFFSCHTEDSIAEACEMKGGTHMPLQYMDIYNVPNNLQSLYECQPLDSCHEVKPIGPNDNTGNCPAPSPYQQVSIGLTPAFPQKVINTCLWCNPYRRLLPW